MIASNISRSLLKQPKKIASLLAWNKNKSLMAINTSSRDTIDIAIAECPSSFNENPFQISISKQHKDQDIFEELQGICDDHNVGASLVYWPISLNSRMGASCGKTIFILDQMAKSSNVISSSRPFALVNYSREPDFRDVEDNFGRCINYGTIRHNDTSSMTYKSNDALSRQCELDEREENCPDTILREFIKEHWPKYRLENTFTYKSVRSNIYKFDTQDVPDAMYL